MLLLAFTQWWYGPGWRDAADRLTARLSNTYLTFSLPILLKTMFAPWKRIVTYPGVSIQDRTRAAIDNLISRIVGFGVRLFALIAAIAIMGATMLFGGLILILWPVLPLLGPILIVAGLII
jgi:hypothetical protein